MKFLLSTLCLGSAAAAVNPTFLQESMPARAAELPPSPVAVAAVPAAPAAPFPGAAPAAPAAPFPGAAPAVPAAPAVASPFARVAPAAAAPAAQQDEKELARAAKDLEKEVARLKEQLESMRNEVESGRGRGVRTLRRRVADDEGRLARIVERRARAEEDLARTREDVQETRNMTERHSRRVRALRQEDAAERELEAVREAEESLRKEFETERQAVVVRERAHADAIRAQAEELRAHAEELFIQKERARRGSEEARAQLEGAERRMQEAHRGMLRLHGLDGGEHEFRVLEPHGEDGQELRAFVQKIGENDDAQEREIAILAERLGGGAKIHRMRSIDDSDDLQVFMVDGRSGNVERIPRFDRPGGARTQPAPPVPPVPPAVIHGAPQGGTTIHINVEEGDVHIDASGATVHTSKGAKAEVKGKDLFGKADGELSFGIAVGGDTPDGPQHFAWTTKPGSEEVQRFFAKGEFPEVVETIEVIEELEPGTQVHRVRRGDRGGRFPIRMKTFESKEPQVFSFSMTLDGDECEELEEELTEALEEVVEEIEEELSEYADTMQIESKIQIDGSGPFIQIWRNGEEVDLGEFENLQVFSAGLEGLEALKGLKHMNVELEGLEALKGLEGLKALEGLENLPFDIDVDVDFDLDDVECILEEVECDIEEQECIIEEEAEKDERFVALEKEAFFGDGEAFSVAWPEADDVRAFEVHPAGTGFKVTSKYFFPGAQAREGADEAQAEGFAYRRALVDMRRVQNPDVQYVRVDPAELAVTRGVPRATTPAVSDAELLKIALEIQAELRAMRSELDALRAELHGTAAPATRGPRRRQ